MPGFEGTHLLLVHARDGFLIQTELLRIGSDHILRIALSGHAVEIRGFDGFEDVRADMERARHGDDIEAVALPRTPQYLSI